MTTLDDARSGSVGTPTPRPTAITLIAWVAIVLGVLMLLSACLGLAAFTIMMDSSGGGLPPLPEGASAPLRFLSRLFRSYDLLAYAQIVLSGIIVASGIAFLRLRQWARSVLEIVCWLGITYVVVFGLFWVMTWTTATATMPAPDQATGLSRMFGLFGVALGVVVTISLAAPPAAAIWFLRSRTVREVLH